MRMLANMSSAPRSRLGVMAHGTASSCGSERIRQKRAAQVEKEPTDALECQAQLKKFNLDIVLCISALPFPAALRSADNASSSPAQPESRKAAESEQGSVEEIQPVVTCVHQRAASGAKKRG
jgi:hypothetical protein